MWMFRKLQGAILLVLVNPSTLNRNAACSSKISESTYRITWCHSPEHHNLKNPHIKNTKTCVTIYQIFHLKSL